MATNNSGADYTLKLGMDTSSIEKSQTRVEAILKRTFRLEKRFNDERVSSARKLLSLETRIANQRLRGVRASSADTANVARTMREAVDDVSRQRTRPEPTATERNPKIASGFTPPRSRRVGEDTKRDLGEQISELSIRVQGGERQGMLGKDFVEQTKSRLQDLRHEIERTSDPVAIKKLRRQYTALNREVNQSIRSAERLNKKLSTQQFISNGLSKSIGNLARSYASIFFIFEAVTHIITVAKRLETANVALINAAGSAEQAGRDFEFARQMANELGLEVISTATALGKFGAAARLGGLTTEETRIIFSDIAKAISGAALSADRASLVFQAFQQVMSKGVLSMEEVRQQIGESLPGGMAALEEATGKSGKELFKFIESGQALSKDVLPKWARVLAKNTEESGALEAAQNSLNAGWNRLLNTITETVKILSDDIGGKGFVLDLLEAAGDVVEVFNLLLKLIKEVVQFLFTTEAELGKTGDQLTGIGRKLSFIEGVIKIISGTWDLFVSGLKTSLFFLGRFLKRWREAGILEIGEALSGTIDDMAKAQKRAMEITRERKRAQLQRAEDAFQQRRKEQRKEDSKSKPSSITANINVNADVTSTDPKQVGVEVGKQVRQEVESWYQEVLSHGY